MPQEAGMGSASSSPNGFMAIPSGIQGTQWTLYMTYKTILAISVSFWRGSFTTDNPALCIGTHTDAGPPKQVCISDIAPGMTRQMEENGGTINFWNSWISCIWRATF